MQQQDTFPRAGSLTIGTLSASTGVNVETIRYYERIGLLPAPRRSAGRHRLYDDDLGRRLAFVRRSRQLGFSIGQIRALLHLADAGGLACAEVQQITLGHLADIRGKIADLRKLERVLSRMTKACDANRLRSCPILEALSRKKS
jgi:MerR family mercuric resistance operon transcriptional regulator